MRWWQVRLCAKCLAHGQQQEEWTLNLSGKRIVVLGGSSGIGLATAQAAAREGAAIVIASSRKTRIEEALATLPTGTEGHALDLADGAATQALFARLGNFDHLVFTAGETLQLGSLGTTDVDAARHFFALRYWGAYCAAKYGSSSIRKGGSVVFTSNGRTYPRWWLWSPDRPLWPGARQSRRRNSGSRGRTHR
jgi:NAD(P)-dependent dehydrogenase (short-subunit alcohol dehydrogenase family)